MLLWNVRLLHRCCVCPSPAMHLRCGAYAVTMSTIAQGAGFTSSRMLKKPASIVLASLRGSTYRSVGLASSFATALLNGLFEHPADIHGLSP